MSILRQQFEDLIRPIILGASEVFEENTFCVQFDSFRKKPAHRLIKMIITIKVYYFFCNFSKYKLSLHHPIRLKREEDISRRGNRRSNRMLENMATEMVELLTEIVVIAAKKEETCYAATDVLHHSIFNAGNLCYFNYYNLFVNDITWQSQTLFLQS